MLGSPLNEEPGMLDTKLEPASADDEAAAVAVAEDQQRPDEERDDEELADEVIVEISVDGMCGVY